MMPKDGTIGGQNNRESKFNWDNQEGLAEG